MEQRFMLAVDPVSGMSITADTTFNSGTFTIDSAITIDANDVTVTGAGGAGTIIKLVSADSTGANLIEIAGRSGVTIDNITLDGNDATLGEWTFGSSDGHWEGMYITNTSSTTIKNMYIHNAGSNGLIWQSGTNSDNHILDSTFSYNGFKNTFHAASGVWLASQSTGIGVSTIERSLAEYNGYHGLGSTGTGTIIKDSEANYNDHVGFATIAGYGITIENNTGTGNDVGASAVGDPGVPNENNANIIRNNTLYDSITNGIVIAGNTSAPQYASIAENNTVDGVTNGSGIGIYSGFGEYVIIRGNTVTDMPLHAILVNADNPTVSGNTISLTSANGININGDAAVISNNTITGTDTGIHIAPSGSGDGVTIEGNSISNTLAGAFGIRVAETTNADVRHNTLTGITYTAIYMYNVNGGSVEHNTITSSTDGIDLGNGDNINVINNIVSGTNYGIALDSSSWNNLIFGNKSVSNTSYDIFVSNIRKNDGDENQADAVGDWDDDGTTGATYSSTDNLRYDFTNNGTVDDDDIDTLTAQIRASSTDPKYDMNADQSVTTADQQYLVTILMGKSMGDANLDGAVNGTDKSTWDTYNGTTGHTAVGTGWSQADFDGDADVDSADYDIWAANADKPVASISATDANAAETDQDPGEFTFSRTGDTTSALTVNYTVTGTAASGDYTETLGGSIVIPAGQASTTQSITPVDDADPESDETVVLTISTNVNYYVGEPDSDTVTIVDNDTAGLPAVTISATDPNAAEAGQDPGEFTFSRTGDTTDALTVNYSVSGAASPADYTETLGGSIVIPATQASTTQSITPVDDTDPESDETVILTLTADAAYNIGTPSNDTVTIVDDDTVVGPEPVAQLDMDENTGTIAYDETANDNDATLYNGVGWVTGQGSYALDFDGYDDRAIIPADATINIGDAVTVTFWINANKNQPTGDYRVIIANKDYDPNPNSTYGFVVSTGLNGSRSARINIDTSAGTNQSFTLGNAMTDRWEHVAFTLDNGNIVTYLDGSEVTSTTYNHGTGFSSSQEWTIGQVHESGTDYGYSFEGTIDDFRIYDEALTASEIEDIYNELA